MKYYEIPRAFNQVPDTLCLAVLHKSCWRHREIAGVIIPRFVSPTCVRKLGIGVVGRLKIEPSCPSIT